MVWGRLGTGREPFDGIDDTALIGMCRSKTVDVKPVNFIIHRGDAKDPGPDQSMIPADDASVFHPVR